MNCQLFARPHPKIMVVSHERSGTHFLMNSLAKCFGYISRPWVNFDSTTLNINFFAAGDVLGYFEQFRGQSVANIVKSHHEYGFFAHSMAALVRDFHVFYVCRDPRDTMVSYWKFLNQIHWHEGPKVGSCKEFIRAEPAGQMLRYQYGQQRSMLHRWRAHVDGWTMGAAARFRDRVSCVRFNDLLNKYDCVIRDIAAVLGETPISFERPKPEATNSILPNAGRTGGYREYFDADDMQYFRDVAGPTMERLGFL